MKSGLGTLAQNIWPWSDQLVAHIMIMPTKLASNILTFRESKPEGSWDDFLDMNKSQWVCAACFSGLYQQTFQAPLA